MNPHKPGQLFCINWFGFATEVLLFLNRVSMVNSQVLKKYGSKEKIASRLATRRLGHQQSRRVQQAFGMAAVDRSLGHHFSGFIKNAFVSLKFKNNKKDENDLFVPLILGDTVLV
ncbi:MAG: hypothetical protein J4215_02865 [Candidatus Diapherotrites archaeon]|uniref:Uncharacterized protein n=1 Tax=Candidatus Iainarchaeum sp. TaxID=3101447 RepID=A0A8T4L2D8_9ARCH|nr:hypothetical protein [Candidatus Diapherotrites archaeon]